MMQNSTLPPSIQPVGQQVSGMKCPVCTMFIPISIPQLLYDGGIMCPHCGLTLTINKQKSRPAMDALRKVEDVTRIVKETESFKR